MQRINLQIAQDACLYARQFIQKSSTALETNSLDLQMQSAIWKAVADMRDATEGNYDICSFEKDVFIYNYERTIDFAKKCSLGNCVEYSCLALEYCLIEKKILAVIYGADVIDIHAEIFTIRTGDHVFLVIGRKIGSDDTKPETWGDDAVICDPWSDLVYPASEYLLRLKNYKRVLDANGVDVNQVEPFNPVTHILGVENNLTTTYLTQNRNFLNLQDNCIYKMNKICAAYEEFTQDLETNVNGIFLKLKLNTKEHLLLKEKLTKMKNAVEIFKNEISRIPAIVQDALVAHINDFVILHRIIFNADSIKKFLHSPNLDHNNYRVVNEALKRSFTHALKNLMASVNDAKEEVYQLFPYAKSGNWMTFLSKWDVRNTVHAANNKLYHELEKLEHVSYLINEANEKPRATY